MNKGQLEYIRDYIIDNIMRNPNIMFSDECRDNIDLPSVIASLYEYLHICVMGERYNYMFHWANKCGAWVDDDIFTTKTERNNKMTEEHIRQIENYKEQMRIRNVRDLGSSLLCGIIFRLLDDGAGVHWLMDEVNGVIEIWEEHHEESEDNNEK